MALTKQRIESSATAITVVGPKTLTTPAEKARAWWRKARRVYPEATLRAWRFDWAVFLQFCKPRGLLPLPASSQTVAAFIADCGASGKKTRHFSPLSLDDCDCASRRQDPESERR